MRLYALEDGVKVVFLEQIFLVFFQYGKDELVEENPLVYIKLVKE